MLDEPLTSLHDSNRPSFLLEGVWVLDEDGEKSYLTILRNKNSDLYDFSLKSNNSLVNGKMIIGGFGNRYVLNIDLAKIFYNNKKIFKNLNHRYLIVGAYFDDENFVVLPSDMDFFLEEFSNHLSLTLESVNDKCVVEKGSRILSNFCGSSASLINIFTLKKSSAFYEDFLKYYDVIFPIENSSEFFRE